MDVGHDEDGTLIGGQLTEPALDGLVQFLALGELLGLLIVGQEDAAMLLIFHEVVDRGARAPLLVAELIIAAVGGDAQYPALEGATAEAGEALEGAQERFLRGVHRCLRVAEDVIGYRVRHLLIRGDELLKGAQISVAARRR